MTLIDTQNMVHAQDGRAYIPSSSNRMPVREGLSRPSGASRFRSALPSPTENALMGTIGRPWA